MTRPRLTVARSMSGTTLKPSSGPVDRGANHGSLAVDVAFAADSLVGNRLVAGVAALGVETTRPIVRASPSGAILPELGEVCASFCRPLSVGSKPNESNLPGRIENRWF